MRPFTTCAFLIIAGHAMAESCPAAPDHSAELTELTRAARSAPDETTGRQISNQMWELWLDAPDAHAKELLSEGMARRESYDFAAALAAFDALIAYCPDYAEGYNQRAFIHYLRRDFEAALPDLEKTLDITPGHVAAMTGQALTLVELNRKAEAALVLRRALDLNPWLGERHLLPVLEAEEEEL